MRLQRRWMMAGVVTLGVLVLTAALLHLLVRSEMRALSGRLEGAGTVAVTAHGAIEYAEWGDGPVALALHGAGGGFDQGRLLAESFGGDGFRWIAPSRFGYLRSPLPEDASTMAQADALAGLLDHLGIDRVALLAMSGGAPPALHFAARYPDRTVALVLLATAPYAPFGADQQNPALPIWAYDLLFRSDLPFWALKHLARARLEALFDVRAELRNRMSDEERRFVDGLVDAFLPVTARRAGLGNEGAAITPGAEIPLADIRAPTLVVHARDDRLAPFAVGEHTAAGIAGAQFLTFETGGHLLLGHRVEARDRVVAFLHRHAGGAER